MHFFVLVRRHYWDRWEAIPGCFGISLPESETKTNGDYACATYASGTAATVTYVLDGMYLFPDNY